MPSHNVIIAADARPSPNHSGVDDNDGRGGNFDALTAAIVNTLMWAFDDRPTMATVVCINQTVLQSVKMAAAAIDCIPPSGMVPLLRPDEDGYHGDHVS